MKKLYIMKASYTINAGWVILLIVPLLFESIKPAMAQQTFASLVDIQEAGSLQSEIKINVGVLRLSTHNISKADMRFLYTHDSWKPEVKLDQGLLSIKQPEEKNYNMKDKERNEWDLVLPRSMAGNLTIRMGAGEAKVDLEGAKINKLDLTAGAGDFMVNLADAAVAELEISAGVGELVLDLSGKRTTNLTATINGGIGDLNLLLPADTGVRIKVNGLGSVDSPGLKKENGYYVNKAYGTTPNTLEVTVNGGLGSVEMALE